jgi:hypothetical protein
VKFGHFITILIDATICLADHIALGKQALAHLLTVKGGYLNELIGQTSSRVEVNLHGALDELHWVSLDYFVIIQHPGGQRGWTVPPLELAQ